MGAYSITSDKDPDAVTLGLGRLGMVAYPTSSPVTYADVGYIKAASFSYNRELKDFESAGLLVKRLVFRDRFKLNADFAEISIDNLQKVFQGTANSTQIEFGGQRTINRFALRFEHQRDDTAIVQITVFKTVPSGDFQLAFAEEEYIKYPVEFDAEADPNKADGKQYGIIKQIA